MTYTQSGKSGSKLSRLGFGCMRLPMTEDKQKVDDELAAPLLQRAVDLGINFFDSHWFYCNYDSQRAVGSALKNIRDNVYISSKVPMWLVERSEDFDTYLEQSLEQMGLDYIDYYHFPYLSYKTWTDKILPLKLIDRAERAISRGLMKHLSFSFHWDPDKMTELIDTGVFATVMGQYNIADRANEELFAYAKDKGVTTIVMTPLMGGVLADGGKKFLERMQSDAKSVAEMAIRFIYGLESADMVLSGMSNMSQLEENVKIAENILNITGVERQGLIDRADEIKSLNDLYCTNCNYCHECPQKIRIGDWFQLYIQHSVWGLTDAVRQRRGEDGLFELNVDPALCNSCGHCLKYCPQSINIPEELKRVSTVLKGL